MEYTEAIETIKSNYPPTQYTMLREALDLAMNALQKQIPQKPIKVSWMPTTCPNSDCDEELSDSLGDGYYKDQTHLKFCSCGQQLDWD